MGIKYTITYRRPIAIIDVRDAVHASSHQNLHADIKYRKAVIVGEYLRNAIKQPVSDDVIYTDTIIIGTNKALSDDVPITDSAVLGVNKLLSDDVPFTESKIFSVNKPLSDNTPITEDVAKGISKPLSDNVTITESVILILLAEGSGGLNGSVINSLPINEQSATRYFL